MCFGHFFGNGQAKPRARGSVFVALAAIKAFKNALSLFRANRGPLIMHREDRIVACRFGGNRDRRAFVRVFDRVIHQLGERRDDQLIVAVHQTIQTR